MKKEIETTGLISLIILGVTVAFAQAGAEPDSKAVRITVREMPAQIVLYTIYRGPYKKSGEAVANLYALAGEKGMRPMGPPTYTYLNNPNRVSSEHWLTEIRIPVNEDALKLAGTLGEMTDVKELPAVLLACAVKPEGMADSGPIYEKIYAWIRNNGYATVDSASEVFLTNATGGGYSSMKVEIVVPVSRGSD